MLEKNIQQKMMDLLKEHGFFSRKVSAENFRGLPDLLVIGHGVTALVEVKTPTGKASKIQQYTMREIRKHGGRTELWSSVADTRRFIEQTTGNH